ncbi:MAG: divergent PAP2 family protein [Candidatus Gastranaerophilales bacterium]|nr:divergent PAP2 family protein [Candidatus Gastranaerophilales bacterium]
MFYNTGYEVLFTGIASACFAQILKVIFYFLTHKKMNFKIFTTTGGMPSSHSAGVISLSVSVGLVEGFSSVSFAIAMGFALIVLQDAAGLRRAAGKTAATLNRLVGEIVEHTNQTKPYEVLKELLGHTPFEVFMGSLLGVVCAVWIHFTMPTLGFLSFLK